MNSARSLLACYEEALLPLLKEEGPDHSLPSPLTPDSEAPLALLFSPHPDDECIIGALPLRLQREHGWRILNVAVTLGSNPLRRSARRDELAKACRKLGWENHELGWTNPGDREEGPARVAALREILLSWRPEAVFYPHAQDGHPVHRIVHHLVEEALEGVTGRTPDIKRVQTEYWHPMENPNLLVTLKPADLARLVSALACHTGEVTRNPYHLTLPAWMLDNGRRGSERCDDPAREQANGAFATLYHAEPAESWRDYNFTGKT